MYKTLVLMLICLSLVGCSPKENQIATPIPTPAVWRVEYSSELMWLLPAFNACMEENSDVGLVVTEFLSPLSQTTDADFIFHWGDIDPGDYSPYQFGSDHIIVAVNSSNSIDQLSALTLQMIYRGEISNWDSVVAGAPNEIRAWVYPEESLIQEAIRSVYFPLMRVSLDAWIAPDVEATREKISDETGAIGFLPASWMNDSVKAVSITDQDGNNLEIPIVLLVTSPIDVTKTKWLACLSGQEP